MVSRGHVYSKKLRFIVLLQLEQFNIGNDGAL